MTKYAQSCAASIADEITNSDDTLSIVKNYANNPRTIMSHETDSDTPRLTLATENGTVISIYPTQNKTFFLEISFEDTSCKNGRFKVKHNEVTLNEIQDLIGGGWCNIEFLRNWRLD